MASTGLGRVNSSASYYRTLTSSRALKGAGIPSARRRRPAARMFFAVLTLRSCTVPQSPQIHALIPRPAIPLGPLRAEHTEQSWVENASLTSANVAPAKAHLYRSIVRKADQPASSTDVACGVLMSAAALTLPTYRVSYPRTSRVEN